MILKMNTTAIIVMFPYESMVNVTIKWHQTILDTSLILKLIDLCIINNHDGQCIICIIVLLHAHEALEKTAGRREIKDCYLKVTILSRSTGHGIGVLVLD